jgi:ElaB/YqjD/DUF883 family membrane-anchored ribosome-binding protein
MGSTATFAVKTGAKLAEMGCQAATARKMARKWWSAAEDLVDEATFAVKRHPMKSVGVGFGMGLLMGCMTGWFAKRGR